MDKTFNIGFSHVDNKTDETQFDVFGNTILEIITDLICLWTDFINENNFRELSVLYVEEC